MNNVMHRSRTQKFGYDVVFTNQSTQMIFNITCSGLIEDVLSGYNSCIFAYGATGSGKTYTMLGKPGIKGINEFSLQVSYSLKISDYLLFQHIFEVIDDQEEDYEFQVSASYVEIYNENIKDLLNFRSSKILHLRDDPEKGLVIANVKSEVVNNISDLMSLLREGNSNRTTESTKANAESSRSHAVLTINVSKKPRAGGFKFQTLTGKLSMIDLAGSERGTVTENRGIRLREGAKINRSLLALANCINALGDKNKKG